MIKSAFFSQSSDENMKNRNWNKSNSGGVDGGVSSGS